MSLFNRIQKFGYEVEYPVVNPEVILDRMEEDSEDLYYHYCCHLDGGGIEFSTPEPASSIREFTNQIHKLYTDIDQVIDYYQVDVPEYCFNASGSGVHIRIDVSEWSLFERFVFTSFFAREMEDYEDFVEWVEQRIGRSWNNWNRAARLEYMYDQILVYEHRGRSDWHNIRYEREHFGTDVYTIEMRMFGVEQDVDDAVKQTDFVKIICDLTEKALQRLGDHIDDVDDFDINVLYQVWKEEYGQEK